METGDNAKAGENLNLDDNVNTRDQRRTLIWLVVLSIIAMGSLVALGMQHMGGGHEKKQNVPDGYNAGEVLEWQHSSVNHPVGAIELPGTIGKDQSFRAKTITAGNTPWTPEETSKLGKSETMPTAGESIQTGQPQPGGH